MLNIFYKKEILDDGQQFLTDIYGFLEHDDDVFVMATLNFIINVEKALFLQGRTYQYTGNNLYF